MIRRAWRQLLKGIALLCPTPAEIGYQLRLVQSGLFDARFYRREHPGLHPVCRAMPMRHFIRWGEAMGMKPNRNFSPGDYLALNPDVARQGLRPLAHFLRAGRAEGRATLLPQEIIDVPMAESTPLYFDPDRPRAPYALHIHIYYPDLWPEFAARLACLDAPIDLFVTVTWRGPVTFALTAEIARDFPAARVFVMPNRGRDILPFVRLVNAGAFEGYRAIGKIHSKKSPHRRDGDLWRQHLVAGMLPKQGLTRRLEAFCADRRAGIWVADGQAYSGKDWWGSNRGMTQALLDRIELGQRLDDLHFPAGSIYWAKPMVVGLLRALRIDAAEFERETGRVDGTMAHAVERAMGFLTRAAGMEIRQAAEIVVGSVPAQPPPPRYVSAFYLPQFHPTAENDRWWGRGYTEWCAASCAQPQFAGHRQPALPADLGYYDLRRPEAMGAQAALARDAGVDAFCVYHYWFGGQRLLAEPMENLAARPEIDFPFYLCWANESWRRNWDGLSGEVLMRQSYVPGYARALAQSVVPAMRDPRYARPNGRDPRFVIYRAADLPDAAAAVAEMRAVWAEAGIGRVEIGAVVFHLDPPVLGDDPFDFHIEMPPHGLITGRDCLFGGEAGNQMDRLGPRAGFGGVIYPYRAAAARALSPDYLALLPPRTIAGVMPAWDNTARRGGAAHIAYGGNPAAFRSWIQSVLEGRIAASYRRELFVNAWNEWGEKAYLEPDITFGRLNLDVLAEATGRV